MIIPPLQETLKQDDFFIYTACDSGYFDEFAKTLINRIESNSRNGIHLHIFNPRNDQLDFCSNKKQISVSYEYISPEQFAPAAQRFSQPNLSTVDADQLRRTQNAMEKGNDVDILERMQKTYYACARFIRLAELVKSTSSVLSIDVDAIVRRSIPKITTGHDFYLHHITGKKSRFLAGGIYIDQNTQGQAFLQQYATALKTSLENDYIYWGLDQDLLGDIVPKFNYGQLPLTYIDWYMRPDSYIWTAKGTRKNLQIFVNEKTKYNV